MTKENIDLTHEIPEVALRWVIHDAVTSNVEIARLSNVSRHWRTIVQEVLLQLALMPRNSDDSSGTLHSPLLLLPSMIRELARSYVPAISQDAGGVRRSNKQDETFCAVWLDPIGIREERVAGTDDSPPENGVPAPNGKSEMNIEYQGYPVEAKGFESRGQLSSYAQDPSRQENSSALRRDQHVNNVPQSTVAIVREWRGYRSPMRVLRSFGYHASFVDGILEAALLRIQTRGATASLTNVPEGNGQQSPNSNQYYQPSFAVRGATVARPEGYCLCFDAEIDDDVGRRQQTQRQQQEEEGKVVEQDASQRPNPAGDRLKITEQGGETNRIQRAKYRRQLQQDVLPSRIWSSPIKNLYEPVNDRSVGYPESQPHRHQSHSQPPQQPSVQFLNSSASQAVCMMTPTFACGPLTEPITIFCIGIATEDGCFLSGLHRRFELGHLYPSNHGLEALEKSSICLATEFDGPSETRLGGLRHWNGQEDMEESECCFGDGDDCDMDQRNGCHCIFHGTVPKGQEMDTESPARLIRGHTGPGAWHCYTVIVDGWDSQIRIDGKNELVQYTLLRDGAAAVTVSVPPLPLTTGHSAVKGMETVAPTSSAVAGSSGDNVQQLAARPVVGKSSLDGLTIGSDHCFGMSLCCGQSSDGEGEGAISEVAVFQGRLDDLDVQVIESQLLAKHGLTLLDESRALWQEMDRLADAMIVLPPSQASLLLSDNPLLEQGSRVPLRFLARHKSVAWKRLNPVDGRPGSVSRIGVKQDDSSSSDW